MNQQQEKITKVEKRERKVKDFEIEK